MIFSFEVSFCLSIYFQSKQRQSMHFSTSSQFIPSSFLETKKNNKIFHLDTWTSWKRVGYCFGIFFKYWFILFDESAARHRVSDNESVIPIYWTPPKPCPIFINVSIALFIRYAWLSIYRLLSWPLNGWTSYFFSSIPTAPWTAENKKSFILLFIFISIKSTVILANNICLWFNGL